MSKTAKHIVYLHQYFRWPELGGPCRSFYLAQGMAEAGYQVTLITGKLPTKLPPDSAKWGFKVIEVEVIYDTNAGIWGRFKSFGAYAVKAYSLIKQLKPDLIYASSTPSTVGLVALFSGKPYIFEARDLWPEVPIEMGYIRSLLLSHSLSKLQQMVYQQAKAVVILNPGMHPFVKPYNTSVFCVPNFADPVDQNVVNDLIDNRIKSLKRSPINVFYGGAIGPANDPDKIARFAIALHKAGHQLVLAPEEGRVLPAQISQLVGSSVITHIGFLNPQALAEALKSSHFNLVSFAEFETLKLTSPNKWFTANACALPSIAFIENYLFPTLDGPIVSSEPDQIIERLINIQPTDYKIMAWAAFRSSRSVKLSQYAANAVIKSCVD